MISAEELCQKVQRYYPSVNCALIQKAYDFSKEAHKTQFRASGDPYFLHPLAVATIIADLKLDPYSVITGLLHDTLEDTSVTKHDIHENFGPEIEQLVEGVTKLTQLELQSANSEQAENFKKLLLALSTDIRVLLVKLADRLHNMRTLHYIEKPEKRIRIAKESLEIYCSLAERIGMNKVKEEIEDIAFKELHTEVYLSIQNRLQYLKQQSGDLVEHVINQLSEKMKEYSLDVIITGREKTHYSIWRKMQLKNVEFEQLADIMAFRIKVETIQDCYQALGVIHQEFSVVPNRFKDYISTPKPNGYQSIHTVVLGPLNQRIEIQIRTREMQDNAEYGLASHWQYKDGTTNQHSGTQFAWVRSLLDILDSTECPEEFLEHTKLEMFKDQVFCFTPHGQLIPLPRGATTVDFAYAIHSDIGNHTISAKVNGRPVPLRSVLNNGDQVEIITDKNQKPSPTWERFVVTGKAKAAIRRFIRSMHRQEFLELGQNLIQKAFIADGHLFCEKALKKACETLNFSSVEDLFVAVGEGKLTTKMVENTAYPVIHHKKNVLEHLEELKPKQVKNHPLSIKNMIPGMAMNYAACCHPIPGDKIMGIITTGKGISVHTKDCEAGIYNIDSERIIDLMWEDHTNTDQRYAARLKIIILNKEGALSSATSSISKQKANIVNFKVINRNHEFWEIFADIEVKDLTHFQHILAALRTAKLVISVERI